MDVLSNVAGALASTMAPQLTRTWNRQAVLAQNIEIKPGGGQGSGQNVQWDVEMTGAQASSFAEGSDVGPAEFTQDAVTKAQLNWGMYRSAFSISNLELNAVAANLGNAAELEDMVGERFIGAISKIVDLMENDMFSGTGTDVSGFPTIVGLDAALAATGSYATISKGTFPTWAGNVNANGGTLRDLNMGILAKAEEQQFISSGAEPGFLMTTAALHTKYEGLFEPMRRTQDGGQGPIQAYQGSTGRLFWRGKPIIRNRVATSKTIYMLSPDDIELRVLPWAAVPDGVMVAKKQGFSSNGKDFDSVNIPFNVFPLGRTGSAIKFVVEIYAQMKVRRPNAHTMIQDIRET